MHEEHQCRRDGEPRSIQIGIMNFGKCEHVVSTEIWKIGILCVEQYACDGADYFDLFQRNDSSLFDFLFIYSFHFVSPQTNQTLKSL
jgi:hypothetical protein